MIEARTFDIETYTGERFSLDFFDPTLIHIEDIAHALAMQCRYNGHCSRFYSVAEHSILLSYWMQRRDHSPRLQLLGLLHDAAEAYLGDLIREVKRALPAFQAIEARMEAAIWEAFCIPPPTEDEWQIVKLGDEVMLACESQCLMKSHGAGWGIKADVDPDVRFRWFQPQQGREMYLSRFQALTGGDL